MDTVKTPYIKYHGSVLLQDVTVLAIPETITVEGYTLHRKKEFHITLTNREKLAASIDPSRVAEIAKELEEEFKAYHAAHPVVEYELENTFYFVQSDSRKSVIAMAKVPALKGFFTRVRQKYGVNVPEQPTHVTLYTLLPDTVGIGLRSLQELHQLSTKIQLDLRVTPNILPRAKFGNPILRQKARLLTPQEICSEHMQNLIADIRYTLLKKPYGVGMAAPQVGESLAFSVIGIKPTPTRPNREKFDMIICNPEIIEIFGRRTSMWEGCISCGTGTDTLYAKVPRYKKIKLRWLDEHAQSHEEILEGLPAHVAQHEVDHLQGILFVDRVKDTTSYMMADEFKKRVAKPNKK
ncbi:MAG TPA: peptide deformylase [Candidatus Saccharimonadales bacterium]|nr:peptide deformylase [Candidatus Saccharimonadales bacterium]